MSISDNLVIHAVHDGHELLEPGLTILLATFGHEVLTEARDHAHDLRHWAHLHYIGKLLVPAHRNKEIIKFFNKFSLQIRSQFPI